jgi:hypothetical protein
MIKVKQLQSPLTMRAIAPSTRYIEYVCRLGLKVFGQICTLKFLTNFHPYIAMNTSFCIFYP